MKIIAILAMTSSRLIGNENGLPWNIPEDLRHFRERTQGNVVVMGRKTYFSLPKNVRPLPWRKNIVFSSEKIPGVDTIGSIDEFIEWKEKNTDFWKIFIIGGATIYNQFFQKGLIDEVDLTLVDGDYEGNIFIEEFREQFLLYSTEYFSGGQFQKFIKK